MLGLGAHLLTEVQRRAYADRAQQLGDPDYWEVPVAELTSKRYAKERANSIGMDRATPSAEVSAGLAFSKESRETTHYSVVDAQRNAVAITVTLNGLFGSGIVIDGAGFLMNNEMDDFSAKPGVPNLYGVVGGDANAIEAGKRMLSSMTPTVIVQNGRPVMVLGSPGGPTIITTVLQVFPNVAVLASHTVMRTAVMGAAGSERPSTPAELAAMGPGLFWLALAVLQSS